MIEKCQSDTSLKLKKSKSENFGPSFVQVYKHRVNMIVHVEITICDFSSHSKKSIKKCQSETSLKLKKLKIQIFGPSLILIKYTADWIS